MQDLTQNNRFMLVGLMPKGTDYEKILREMEELKSLVKTYGGEVFAATVQKADYPNRSTFIGSGKAQEIAETISKEKIDIIVINDIVKPGQLYTLEKIFFRSNPKIKVWDRVNLILQIFSLHAQTKEAKLQIDLANLRHMGPRIYGMGFILSRQGGKGVSMMGQGVTNTQLMKRHYRDEMKQINLQLSKLSDERKRQIAERKNLGFLTCAIVGYTNAGKTMLFNKLTDKDNLVEDALFATLDSSVGKLHFNSDKQQIIVTDTIGFIKNLPNSLIDAFKSTLLESINADLILVIIDVSDPEFREKINVVDEILHELHLEKKNQIYVFNKIDIALPAQAGNALDKIELMKSYNNYHPLFISAKTAEGIDLLQKSIIESIAKI